MRLFEIVQHHHYHHDEPPERVIELLQRIVTQQQEFLMVSEATKAALARIETATTDLGTRVRAIQEKVGIGMTDADVTDVNTELGSIASNLEGMAKDPENPIPPAV
jgi:hypothetical protein